MNKWLKIENIDYKSSPDEMTATILNFCKDNPYADSNDATNHLRDIVNLMKALGM